MGPLGPLPGKLLAAPPIPRQPGLALLPRETSNKEVALLQRVGKPLLLKASVHAAHLAPLGA